jgi:DSF synthase
LPGRSEPIWLRAIDGEIPAPTNDTRSEPAHPELPARPVLLRETPRAAGVSELWFADDFNELELRYEPREQILWYYMRPRQRQSFTIGLLRDIRRLQERIRELFVAADPAQRPRLRYLVLASASPDTFNLGGDLSLLAQLIRAQDRGKLESYARACVDVLYPNAVALDVPIITVSLVQGHALGGGFEAALSSNVVIAEETAKFGLPEVLFNLFPGMGAYSLLARRIGMVDAERMITSGKVMSARELYEQGVLDAVVPKGEGEKAVYELIARQNRRFNSHLAIYRTRRRYQNLSYEELKDIATIWVDAALRLTDADLRKMDRLAGTQDRRQLRTIQGA